MLQNTGNSIFVQQLVRACIKEHTMTVCPMTVQCPLTTSYFGIRKLIMFDVSNLIFPNLQPNAIFASKSCWIIFLIYSFIKYVIKAYERCTGKYLAKCWVKLSYWDYCLNATIVHLLVCAMVNWHYWNFRIFLLRKILCDHSFKFCLRITVFQDMSFVSLLVCTIVVL